MKNISISCASVVAPVCDAATLRDISSLNRLAYENVVEMHFREDYCRIIGEKNRKVKVPKKATLNGEGLVEWIRNRINNEWK